MVIQRYLTFHNVLPGGKNGKFKDIITGKKLYFYILLFVINSEEEVLPTALYIKYCNITVHPASSRFNMAEIIYMQ